MGRGQNSVTLVFAGDSDKLERTFAKVGVAAKAMTREVEASGKKLGPAISTSLFDSLGALPSQLKGAAIVAAAAIGAVMAPALASAIISGVLLAVGGGVLAAGIVGAAKDPRVVNAWKRFGSQAGKTFERFSQPFVRPLIRAADVFGAALKRAEPTILAIGRVLAPVIDRLAPAVALMAERFLPGIQKAAAASVPFFEALAAHAPGLGEATGKLFENIAKGAPGALKFFERFLSFVEKLLPKLGEFVTWLSDLGTKMENFLTSPGFVGLKTALTKFADDTLAGVKQGLDNIKVSVDTNSESWDKLGKAITVLVEKAGPVFKWLAETIGTSVGAAIDWLATLVEAVDRVISAFQRLTGQEVLKSAPKLPGSSSGFQGFASGGVGSGLAMVGEQGRELVDLGGGSRVYNHADTERMLSGGGTVVIQAGGSGLDRMFLTWLQGLLRANNLQLVQR